MALDKCIRAAMQAVGRDLDADELVEIRDAIDARVKRARVSAKGDAAEDAVLAAVEDYAGEIVSLAVIEKRNTVLNLRARVRAKNYVEETFAETPWLGVQALDVGVAQGVKGARFSAAAQQEELAGHYLGGLIADLEKTGQLRLFVSGQMDQEIWRAMAELNRARPDTSGMSREAVDAAEVLNKWNEVARVDANHAGAWIKKLEGWVIRQTHDAAKIRRAGFDSWRAFMLERLDLERTFPDADNLDTALRQTYNGLASGVHLRAPVKAPTGLKGIRNIGREVSHERVLHFKNPDAGFEYNVEFGTGNLREGMLYGLERAAQNTGLMRAWGPNPEANRDQVIDGLLRAAKDDPERARTLRNRRESLDLNFKQITGETRVPANEMLAQVGHTVRAVETLSKLGGAVLSAVGDIPLYGSEIRYQGQGMLGGMAEAIGGLFKGKTSTEKKELLGMLGVFMDGMRGTVAGRFNASDTIPGTTSKILQVYFKLNGLQWWTDKLKTQAALAMSHRLALRANDGWDAMPSDLQRVLGLFGLDEARWDIVRRSGTKAVDGREYVTPEGLDALPDEAFAGIIEGKLTKARVRRAKQELASQLRAYFSDRADTAVILPSARTRALMLRGTRPGTVEGELMRFVMQFKAFPISVLNRVVAREIYGRGDQTTLFKALRNGNGELLGLAQLMVWTTLFGYAAMSLKDISKGRTPRNPDSVKTWTAAALQGGALGIYGDFLFGELRTRYGGGPLSSLLGPAAGTFEDLTDLAGRARNGDPVAGQAFRVALNNTPFVNLFYTRAAFDYLFAYQVSESLSPGWARRLERRVKKQNDQTFLISPTAAVR